MADSNPKGLGRGRGLLLRNIAQRRAAEEAAEKEAKKAEEKLASPQLASPQLAQRASPQLAQRASPQLTQRASPQLAQRASPQLAQRASPQLTQRASPQLSQRASPQLAQRASPQLAQRASPQLAQRASPQLAQRASPQLASPKIGVASQPMITGRGRGMMARLAARSIQAKVGKVDDEETLSFRSEDFETSSRIGEVIPIRGQSVDPRAVADKLKKLEVATPTEPPKSSSGSGSGDGQPKSILKKSPDEATCRSPGSSGSKPQLYRGIGGKTIEVAVNYMKLQVAQGYGIFEYEVLFEPSVDSRGERYSAVNQHRELLGLTKSFDGHKLYLPKQLKDPDTRAVSKHTNGMDIKVTFRYKRAIDPGDRESLYIYNLIFKKIMKTLKFVESAKKANYFDPKGGKEIKEFKLLVWPGYITVVDVFEGGLYLQVDVANRVLRTETVRDVFMKLKKGGGANFKDDAEKALLGCSVITRYNNKSYKIDGIEFSESPKTEFTLASGAKTSFYDYYKNQYGVEISDMGQPLLIHRPKIKGISEATAERIVKLVPELCFMTGMTDAMRADFKIMKEVGAFTRLNPAQRQESLNNFIQRVKTNNDAYVHLTDWGLKMDDSTAIVQGRVLEPETIMFGKGYREVVRPNADWGRAATTKHVLTAVNLTKWAILFAPKNENVVKTFCGTFREQAPKMGIQVANPRVVKLKDDRTETFLKELRGIIDPSVQLVVTIFPQLKADRYSAVKKLCCVEMPVASQVVIAKTIMNEKRLTSVAQKIILQINCKLGGELWACPMPFKDLMIVGIDVYHDASRKGSSFAGVVSSMNDLATRYYSMVKEQKQGQEIMDALRIAFIESLIKYWEVNRKWPSDIVVFRDGVGDGQLDVTKNHECEQFMAVFNKKRNGKEDTTEVSKMESRLGDMLPENYKPGFVFVVVQKRINTRLLAAARKGNRYEYTNPPPGTVLDHSVTRFKYKDFFLVPQSVNQGTVSPTHFIVLKEQLRPEETSAPLDASGIQKLSYRLTHMYYNWPGTVRVPAPVQYAHKLVDLVGQHVHRVPAAQLSDKLFYL